MCDRLIISCQVTLIGECNVKSQMVQHPKWEDPQNIFGLLPVWHLLTSANEVFGVV